MRGKEEGRGGGTLEPNYVWYLVVPAGGSWTSAASRCISTLYELTGNVEASEVPLSAIIEQS